MKYLAIVLAIACAVSFITTHAQQSDYDALKIEAEKLYSEGSYARARELYSRARELAQLPAERRWIDFRLADTLWRSQAATKTSDSTKYDEARRQLEVLIRDLTRVEDHDRIWAEVQESLGDFWWMRNDSRNWSQGWQHYQQALDWWAGSSEIDQARDRYLKIVWKTARPTWSEPGYYYGYYGNFVPLAILENATKIAQTENDRAHLHYLTAMTIRSRGGNWEERQRVPEEFETALSPGKSTDWYDDALYHYAEWMSSTGRINQLANGQWQQQPDYVRAVELFRRLLSEYQKGETRYYDQAKNQVDGITRPSLGVAVSNAFLPDSEIQFHLSWRNVKRLEFALYSVDLTRDLRLSNKNEGAGNWIQRIDISTGERIKSWGKDTEDRGNYTPGNEMMRLDGKLAAGAYVIEVSAGQATARDLILVSDASLVLKTSGKQALLYFANAANGSPNTQATVALWERGYDGREYVWNRQSKTTGADGIAVFDLTHKDHNTEVFAAAASGNLQAFANGYSSADDASQQPWRIYAFTDRPAFRPGEEAHWKIIARRYSSGVYSTPANQKIEFEITDPRGTKVKEGESALNAFGGAWGSLQLTDTMPLGEYQVTFWDDGRRQAIGSARLFRLEEYKLPEFKVSVTTPEEGGKKQAFRLGERVDVNVQADYYFGGAVSNATVEVLVYQNPFYHYWRQPRDYGWYYEDLAPQYRSYGRGQIVKRETLKTDAAGKATLRFDTPRNAQQDFEYIIEARVTDASRREIVGSSNVRVTRQRYYVYPRARHYIHRPQDKVSIDFKTMDANEQPIQVEGQIKVTRDYWYEIWLDPNGREVKGDELKRLRERNPFPPPVVPGTKPWQLKFQGYEHDDILTQGVKTNAQGEAEFNFTPEREGYYRIAWSSDDKGAPIRSDTAVWVATGRSTELGYRHGGLEIIVDKDTFRAGQKAPVMLVAPTNDRFVLFSIEGEDLYSYQLVHLEGTVKLIEVPVEDKHVPNIFLSAAMVTDRQIFTDTKQVIVPPVEHFLNVEVKPDRIEYQPREQGTLTVTTRDADGKPVAAEVAVGMVDESVFYIQQNYAADPRQFYYGAKRAQRVQTTSTFQQRAYVRLVEGVNKQLVDDRIAGQKREFERLQLLADLQAAPGVRGDALGRASESKLDSRSEMSERDEAGKDKFKEENLPINGRQLKSAGMAPAEPGAKEPAVQVRSDFRSTAVWQPDVVTDRNGKAIVKVKFPDSLTGWTATARAASTGSQFGIATASARTKQPLIVRLQAPRFFVVGDSVAVSAVINNNTDSPMTVVPSLAADGVTVTGMIQAGETVKGEAGSVIVQPNGESRVDWQVAIKQPGNARLKVTARGNKHADAMEKHFVVYDHGIEKFVAKSGKLRGDNLTVKLDIPAERNRESTSLSVQVTPSMAVTMLDALPYLIDYPYGCTEQTMSRFLPAVITRKTLKDLGLNPEAIMGRIFGGIERTNAAKTHPGGEKDLRKLDDMTKQGLERLYNFQHDDGGWGWWKEGESDHFMTAYVVWGLVLAREAGIDVEGGRLDRAAEFLEKEIVEEELNFDQQSWMLHALAIYHRASAKTEIAQFQAKAFDNLWENRDRLNAYTRALLALSAHSYGSADRARTLVGNLENGVKRDTAPDTSLIQQGAQASHDSVMGTAHWGEDGLYWRWSEGGVEATSFALRALLAIDPKNKLIEPVTNWLIKNRRGAQWSNTRDTAITVLTLNEYLRQSGELAPDLEYDLSVNGQLIATRSLTGEDALGAPSQFEIDRQYLRDGVNEIHITRKRGNGPIYFAASARFFSLEEPITPAGNEIFVRREYFKLVGKPTLLKGHVYDRQPLGDGEVVTTGDRVEAVITIEAKNNYEYLLFEDLKPAGLEAVQIRSGQSLFARELKSGAVIRKFADGGSTQGADVERGAPHAGDADHTGRTQWVYQELRDRKVAMFIDKLPEGVWEIRYDMRAEVPGTFHALPVIGHAMYVPEIRCNGSEVRIKVAD
jgi:alpha-2-macroglobulin